MVNFYENWRERPDPPIEEQPQKEEVPWWEDSAFDWPDWYYNDKT